MTKFLNNFVIVNRGGRVAKCQHLSTRGREGVKNTQNPFKVVYKCPLITIALLNYFKWDLNILGA